MKLAILADIHGNLPALDAVARELERLQPDYVVVNGDLINGVPFSAEVIDRIRALGAVSVRKMDGIEETTKFPLPKGLRLEA